MKLCPISDKLISAIRMVCCPEDFDLKNKHDRWLLEFLDWNQLESEE